MARCRLCNSDETVRILDFGLQPVAHAYVSETGVEEPRYRVEFDYCQNCGFVQLATPLPHEALYQDNASYTTSHQAQPHVDDELDTLISLAGTDKVLEIGCNAGDFLDRLKERGLRAYGIESNVPVARLAEEKGHRVFTAPLSSELASTIASEVGLFGAIVSRQVFEHVVDMQGFLAACRAALAPRGILLLEVPDRRASFRAGDVSLMWEEHVNYFDEALLSGLLERNGFTVRAVRNYNRGGGSIAVFAQNQESSAPVPMRAIDCADAIRRTFVNRVSEQGQMIREAMALAKSQGRRVFVYGGGFRAVLTINYFELAPFVDQVVDDRQDLNHAKLPGSQLEIRSLDESRFADDVVVFLAVGNDNEHKVMKRLREHGFPTPTAFSMLGPKDFRTALASASELI